MKGGGLFGQFEVGDGLSGFTHRDSDISWTPPGPSKHVRKTKVFQQLVAYSTKDTVNSLSECTVLWEALDMLRWLVEYLID